MSRMFKSIDKTWNVFVGCRFDCTYCNAKKAAETRFRHLDRYKDGFNPHLVESELNKKFKPGEFIFVAYMGDIYFASRPIIIDLCCRIIDQPNVDFLFCSKSPLHYWYWHIVWPDNLYLGATIETNRDYHLTKAPAPLYRYKVMWALDHPKKFISIEPVCDFDLDVMLSWIGEIKPQIIEIGADNYHNNLPEPSPEKLEQLLANLRDICPTVIEKDGLSRLKEVYTKMYNVPRCPHCRSLNIYPQAKLFFCKDCGKDFDQAMVEQEPPKSKKKGRKG